MSGDQSPREEPPARDPVPRIGRCKLGFRPTAVQLMTIITALIALIAVIALRGPCSQGVGNMFKQFEAPIDAGPVQYIPLGPPPAPSR